MNFLNFHFLNHQPIQNLLFRLLVFLNLDLFQLFNIPAIALFYFVLFKTTRISAIASILTVALTAGLLMFANNGFLNILVLTFVFILILVKHSENIKRLIEGKENKF